MADDDFSHMVPDGLRRTARAAMQDPSPASQPFDTAAEQAAQDAAQQQAHDARVIGTALQGKARAQYTNIAHAYDRSAASYPDLAMPAAQKPVPAFAAELQGIHDPQVLAALLRRGAALGFDHGHTKGEALIRDIIGTNPQIVNDMRFKLKSGDEVGLAGMLQSYHWSQDTIFRVTKLQHEALPQQQTGAPQRQ